ncbi:MAG: tetratricopeptide repeat protein [Proteobacteria bacterium]|nr:tetratricopeptide repeat protein [Pseudomonadota bacterium]
MRANTATRTPSSVRLKDSFDTATTEHQEQFMRRLLRRTPYWSTGHLWLAEQAFFQNRIEVAFCEAQAVLALSNTQREVAAAQRVVARCHLKSGDYSAARALLSALVSTAPTAWDIREDFAATLLQQGDFDSAASELRAIPSEQLSGEGRAALDFVNSKVPPKEKSG